VPCLRGSTLHNAFSVPGPRRGNWRSGRTGQGCWGAMIGDNKLMAVRGTSTVGEALKRTVAGGILERSLAVSTRKHGTGISPGIRSGHPPRCRLHRGLAGSQTILWPPDGSPSTRLPLGAALMAGRKPWPSRECRVGQTAKRPRALWLGGSGCTQPILALLGRPGTTGFSPADRVGSYGLPKDIGTMCGWGRQRVAWRRAGTHPRYGTGLHGEWHLANPSGRLENR